ESEIIVAIEANLAGTPGDPRSDRGQRRPSAGLTFLTAEGAAHASRLDSDEGVRDPENARDDMLRLRRVLARRVHHQLIALAGNGERRLTLQIEVLLAADRELAPEPMRGLVDRGDRVAAP